MEWLIVLRWIGNVCTDKARSVPVAGISLFPVLDSNSPAKCSGKERLCDQIQVLAGCGAPPVRSNSTRTWATRRTVPWCSTTPQNSSLGQVTLRGKANLPGPREQKRLETITKP